MTACEPFGFVPVAHCAPEGPYSTRFPSPCMTRLYWPFGEEIAWPELRVLPPGRTLCGRYANRSTEVFALVPPGPVTVTSTVPLPAGAVAVIDVEPLTVTPVAAVAPNLTVSMVVKFDPVTVTLVPPATGPLVGLIVDTVGRPPPNS